MIVNMLILILLISCFFREHLVFADTQEESDLQSSYQKTPRLLPNTPLFYIDDMSYYLGIHQTATYAEAVQVCEMMNMRLATVKSARVNSKLYEYMKSANIATKSDFWVSGSNMVDRKTWLWMTTAERMEYFNWDAEFNQPDGNQYCLDIYYVKAKGLTWFDATCTKRYNYICERPKNLYCPGPLDKRLQYFADINGTSCSSGAYNGDLTLIKKDGMTYYVETSQELSKYDAEKFCNSHQMQLVTINNEKDNSILRDVLLLYAKKNNRFWTSAKRENAESPWLWGDGKPIEYFNWGPGEPNNLSKDENCIEVFTNNNVIWNDHACTVKRNFICQGNQEPRHPQGCCI